MNNRERLLEVRRFFERHTDDNHPKTLEDLLEYLSTIGDTSKLAKKSVKDDIQALTDSGFEVQDELEKNGLAKKYWHSARLFEIHELRMMVDAIVAAKFISEDVTERIVEKLQKLTSIPEAETLQSIIKTPKKKHGQIPYHIDRIQRAIQEQKAISFQYTDVVGFDATKRTFPLRRDGERYVVNPIDLHWNHEQYYLIGIDESI
ncbi:MAG: WYL domain-containing protein, partial [Exiguobacterium mexicanum]